MFDIKIIMIILYTINTSKLLLVPKICVQNAFENLLTSIVGEIGLVARAL